MMERIEEFIKTTLYNPCLFLVHPEIDRLATAVSQLKQQYTWPGISINHVVSQKLMTVAPNKRSQTAHQTVASQVENHKPGPVICTEPDILFEPALELDPFRLFLDISRRQQTRCVILWPGTISNNVLAYASQEHAHYKTWRNPDADFIVQIK